MTRMTGAENAIDPAISRRGARGPSGSGTRLNIGAGQSRIPGFINVDISKRADISLDLSTDALPFDDNSIDLIVSYHTLEHVDDYLFALGEIHRVLKHGAPFLVGLPYVTLTEYHLVNPYHRHNFNEHSFRFFELGKLKGSAVEENQILFREVFHRLHYIGGFHLVPPPFRSWCRRHLYNVVHKIDFGLQCVKDASASLPVVDRRGLMREYRGYLAARVPYEQSSHVLENSRLFREVRAIRAWWRGKGE